MTGKLMLHTALCAFIAFSLHLRLRDTTRRRETMCLMLAAAMMGLCPHVYNLLPRGVFPRMTIHWSQLMFLAVSAVWFAPNALGRARYDAPWAPAEDDDTPPPDHSQPRGGMPLH